MRPPPPVNLPRLPAGDALPRLLFPEFRFDVDRVRFAEFSRNDRFVFAFPGRKPDSSIDCGSGPAADATADRRRRGVRAVDQHVFCVPQDRAFVAERQLTHFAGERTGRAGHQRDVDWVIIRSHVARRTEERTAELDLDRESEGGFVARFNEVPLVKGDWRPAGEFDCRRCGRLAFGDEPFKRAFSAGGTVRG